MNKTTRTGAEGLDPTEVAFTVSEASTEQFIPGKLSFVPSEDSESTIRRVLSHYELGRKIRQLRLKKKIALVDLGKHTGLSASMLSQLENGKLVPTLPTLARIAMVFDVSLDHFFADRRKAKNFSIVRASERIRFPESPDSPHPGFFFECLDFNTQDKSMQAYLAEFPPRDPKSRMEHAHGGAEMLYVLEGSIAIWYQDEEHLLDAGDSVYFDASEPHTYRGVSDKPARAVVVTTPARP